MFESTRKFVQLASVRFLHSCMEPVAVTLPYPSVKSAPDQIPNYVVFLVFHSFKYYQGTLPRVLETVAVDGTQKPESWVQVVAPIASCIVEQFVKDDEFGVLQAVTMGCAIATYTVDPSGKRSSDISRIMSRVRHQQIAAYDEWERKKSEDQQRQKDEASLRAKRWQENWESSRLKEVHSKRLKAEAEEHSRKINNPEAQAKRARRLQQVFIGSVVTAVDLKTGESDQYHLLKPEDNLCDSADLIRLSCDSPLAAALLYKFVGDEVRITSPGVTFRCRIVHTGSPKVGASRNPMVLSSRDHETEAHEIKTSIGSDTWCFAAREQGQFGSFCKHDDFGDESDAESRDSD